MKKAKKLGIKPGSSTKIVRPETRRVTLGIVGERALVWQITNKANASPAVNVRGLLQILKADRAGARLFAASAAL